MTGEPDEALDLTDDETASLESDDLLNPDEAARLDRLAGFMSERDQTDDPTEQARLDTAIAEQSVHPADE